VTLTGSRVVIDSNVMSYIARRSPIADYYLPYLAGREVVISFQTREEALFGAYLAGWGERRVNDLKQQMDQYEVHWPDDELVDLCARLRQQRQAAGRRLEVADAWVAATALYLECPLASHDGDFDDIPDLQLIRAPTTI
jgi:predicted nucleic acid-binding protein